MTLHAFGDESADAKQERVFAVAAVFGTEDEWELAMREWLRRTRGLPFHATDCEAVRGEGRQDALDLYRDLTQILAKSFLVGFAVALDMESYKKTIGDGPKDWAYFKALGDLIRNAAQTARSYNGANEESVNLRFTFDSRLESNGTGTKLYSMMTNDREWDRSRILHHEIAFESGAVKSLRLEVGDLFAREAMKELDRKITGIPSKARKSYLALSETKKFHFIEHRENYWVRLRDYSNTPAAHDLMRRFDEWCVERGQIDGQGQPVRNNHNWILFNSWLDSQDKGSRDGSVAAALPITEIWIDSGHRLCARTDESLEFIYRSAMEVHWDREGAYLYSPAPRERSHARWMQQFADAVRSEYNRALIVTPRTVWRDIDSSLRQEIEAALAQR